MRRGCLFCFEQTSGQKPDNRHEPGGPDCEDHRAIWEAGQLEEDAETSRRLAMPRPKRAERTRNRILSVIEDSECVDARTVSERTGISPSHTRRFLKRLVSEGYLSATWEDDTRLIYRKT